MDISVVDIGSGRKEADVLIKGTDMKDLCGDRYVLHLDCINANILVKILY